MIKNKTCLQNGVTLQPRAFLKLVKVNMNKKYVRYAMQNFREVKG